jgi:hypothetical protein
MAGRHRRGHRPAGIPDNWEGLPLVLDAHVVKGEGVNLALGPVVQQLASSFLRGSGASCGGASWGGASWEVLGAAGPLAVLRAGALAPAFAGPYYINTSPHFPEGCSTD